VKAYSDLEGYIDVDCRLKLVVDTRCGPLHSVRKVRNQFHGRLGGVMLAETLLAAEVKGSYINVSCKL